MSLNGEELGKNMTTSPTLRLFNYIEEKFSREKVEEVKNFKFAMGMISGHYEENPKSIFGQKGFSERLRFLDQNYQKGPNGEIALADVYAVLYKNTNNTIFKDFGKPDCSWLNQVPIGFSCVKGSEKLRECDGNHERYVQVPCDEIVLKIAIDTCTKRSSGLDLASRNLPICISDVNWR